MHKHTSTTPPKGAFRDSSPNARLPAVLRSDDPEPVGHEDIVRRLKDWVGRHTLCTKQYTVLAGRNGGAVGKR